MVIIFLVQSAHTVPGLHPYIAASTFSPLISLDGFKEKCHVLCDYNTMYLQVLVYYNTLTIIITICYSIASTGLL